MEKVYLVIARSACCMAAALFAVALLATPMVLRADDPGAGYGMPPPGGNGTTCHNWNPQGVRQCDNQSNCMSDPNPTCAGDNLCINNGVLPCNVCQCRLFQWAPNVTTCECQDPPAP